MPASKHTGLELLLMVKKVKVRFTYTASHLRIPVSVALSSQTGLPFSLAAAGQTRTHRL